MTGNLTSEQPQRAEAGGLPFPSSAIYRKPLSLSVHRGGRAKPLSEGISAKFSKGAGSAPFRALLYQGNYMMKSNHLRKVEKLIQVRSDVRRITGLLEAIYESIELWKRTDKLEEYWDFCWSNDPGIQDHVTRLKTGAALSHHILVRFDDIHWMSDPEFYEGWLAIKGSEMFHRVLPEGTGKRQIARLQPIARREAYRMDNLILTRWKSWRRKGSIWTHEQADFVHQELLKMEYEIGEAWSRILDTTFREPHRLSLARP
jgi:hypothetical protein